MSKLNSLLTGLTDENVDEAKKELGSALQELTENIKKWNDDRKNEINAFLKKAK